MEENQNMDIVDREVTCAVDDVEHLASSIEATMSIDLRRLSNGHCIFTTPIALYRQNKRAYIPDAFSIGPLHHDNPILKTTERIKAHYLQSFLDKSRSSKTMLRDMIKYMNNWEQHARYCYSVPIDYSSKEFVKILVTDSCFIIELFIRNAYEMVPDDPIFSTPSMLQVLDHDLILLENQVPWSILEDLFNKYNEYHGHRMTLIELAIEFFLNVYSFTISYPPPQDIKHIPDLFKKLMVLSIQVDELGKKMSYRQEPELSPTHLPKAEIEFKKSKLSYRWEPVPSATRLLEAGIKFEKRKSTNMFDIKFRNGVLEIPQIRIHEITETFMKNLISFEQCYPKSDDCITSYAILLDNLIDTTKDVEILRERNILSICMNSEDAVQFFNKLYHTTCVNNLKYMDLCKDLNAHCQKRWPRWRALLVRRYFNTPWAGLSTAAAVTLLILSFLQTIYSIKK